MPKKMVNIVTTELQSDESETKSGMLLLLPVLPVLKN
jgi:hypothetical protein